MTKEEAALTRSLAFEIVRKQQRHMVVSPWALMASVLMQSRDGVTVRQLVRETEWLKRQTVNLGAYVDWPGPISFILLEYQYHDIMSKAMSMVFLYHCRQCVV